MCHAAKHHRAALVLARDDLHLTVELTCSGGGIHPWRLEIYAPVRATVPLSSTPRDADGWLRALRGRLRRLARGIGR